MIGSKQSLERTPAVSCTTSGGGYMVRGLCLYGLLGATFLAYSPGIAGQSAPDGPKYDVASIKLRTDCGVKVTQTSVTPGGIRFTCAQAANLIALAYTPPAEKVFTRRPKVLGGPAWLNRDRYD